MKLVRAAVCALVVAGLLSVPVISVGPGNASAGDRPRWRPPQGAFFNLPRAAPQKEFRAQAQIVAAINHARPGSTIRMSLFSWDRKPPAEAVIRARKRGVRVQILLNDHQITPAQRMLHKRLGRNPDRDNFAYECRNGCRSSGENLHSKFFLFTHTGAARNVVMTGSLNFTTNGAVNQYNDVYVVNESQKLHDAFVAIFEQMRKDRLARPTWWHQRVTDRFEVGVTPYPNFSPRNDPIMTMLNRVHCKGATGGTGNNGRTMVRVVMHTWNEYRGVYLAKKIRSLYANGCDVRLLYGYAGEDVRGTFDNRTPRGYIPVHTTGYDTNEDGFIDLYTHQKELMISGNYGSDRSTRLVVTGSSNYNDEGLKGDEEIFVIKRDGAFRQYHAHFKFLWNNRSTQVKYIPYGRTSLSTARQSGIEPLGSASPELKRFGPAWETG